MKKFRELLANTQTVPQNNPMEAMKAQFVISELKKRIAATDYKVTKCYEYTLVGKPLPYDIEALHAERQALRDKINELEGGD